MTENNKIQHSEFKLEVSSSMANRGRWAAEAIKGLKLATVDELSFSITLRESD